MTHPSGFAELCEPDLYVLKESNGSSRVGGRAAHVHVAPPYTVKPLLKVVSGLLGKGMSSMAALSGTHRLDVGIVGDAIEVHEGHHLVGSRYASFEGALLRGGGSVARLEPSLKSCW